MKAVLMFVLGINTAAVLNPGRADEPPVPLVLKGHTKGVSALAWAADGTALATGGDDRTVRVWDPATGRQTAVLPDIAREGSGNPALAFRPDLKVVAVYSGGEITLRTVADGKVRVKIDPILDRGVRFPFPPGVSAMAFSPDGKRLATCGSVAAVGGPHGLPGGIVIVWDAETGKIVHKTDWLSTAASSVTWGLDGKRFAAGTNGAGGELPEAGELWVWDAETGRNLYRFSVQPKVKPGEWVSAGDVALDPNSKWVATPLTAGSRGNPAGLLLDETGASIRVWDLGTGKSLQPVKRLNASVGRVVFSPDGKQLATSGSDSVVRVWDVATGNELAALPSPGGFAAIAFSPDGRFLAGGSGDASVRIWAVPGAK